MIPISVLLNFYERSFFIQPILFNTELKAHCSAEKKWDFCIILHPFQGSGDITEEGTKRLLGTEVREIWCKILYLI